MTHHFESFRLALVRRKHPLRTGSAHRARAITSALLATILVSVAFFGEVSPAGSGSSGPMLSLSRNPAFSYPGSPGGPRSGFADISDPESDPRGLRSWPDATFRLSSTSYERPVEIDLSGHSGVDVVPTELISGPNPERFSYIRKGPSFGYFVRKLPPSGNSRYDAVLYFAERATRCPGAATFKISWAPAPDIGEPTELLTIDLCSSGTLKGAVRAATLTVLGLYSPSRSLYFRLDAVSGNAALSQIRIAPAGSLGSADKVIFPDESRLDYRHRAPGDVLPPRPLDKARYRVREAVLSRFGTRFVAVASPQRLGFSYSALGIDAADLSELVVVVSTGSALRAFPLTDRYPLFEEVTQTDRPTSVRFDASDRTAGIAASLELRAPFWPEDETTSMLPAFYLDVAVTNTATTEITPEVFVAVPVRYDSRDELLCTDCYPRAITTTAGTPAVVWAALEAVGPASSPAPGTFEDSRTVRADYGLAALSPISSPTASVSPAGSGEATGGRATSSWLPASSEDSGVPVVGKRIHARKTRGHAGLVWSLGEASSGTSLSASAVLAAYIADPAVGLSTPTGESALYRFRYSSMFSDLASVLMVAASDRANQLDKARRFDDLISGREAASLGPRNAAATQSLRQLQALAYRSYVANTWWLERSLGGPGSPPTLFTVTEGSAACCRFQATLDVAFNDSQFLLQFWPSLLAVMLEQWKLFSYRQDPFPGLVAPHDIGLAQRLAGQTYIPMPVEENANFVLLLYAYWKATGDLSFAAAQLPHVERLFEYVLGADTDADGLPDHGVSNTIDAANPTLFASKGQTYLGLKVLAAARAAKELASAASYSSSLLSDAVDRLAHAIVHTLENASWRGDHFAVSVDPGSRHASLRNYGSIYPPATQVYNLQFGGDLPVPISVLEQLRTDAEAVAASTRGPYGSVHMQRAETSGWASQSIWRDMGALFLGAGGADGSTFLDNLRGYLEYQLRAAQEGDGGWWDEYRYIQGSGGVLEAMEMGLSRGVLGYYPRGAVIFGFAQAFAGISIDASSRTIGLLPWGRPGARVPLYTFADWSSGNIPYARVAQGNPPLLVLEGTSPKLAGMTTSLRNLEFPELDVTADSVSAIRGETATVSVGAFAGDVSLSVGGRGNWMYRVSAPAPSSATFDGTRDGVPVADGQGTGCALPARPRPRVLQAPNCRPLGIDSNTAKPSTRWYFAEGSTAWGFETYLLVQNPGDAAASVEITYMTHDGPLTRPGLEVPPRSRRTVVVSNDLPNKDFATEVRSSKPVVVERAMYWRSPTGAWREGHVVTGLPTLSRRWYLPEGSTAWGFDEWILLQNPGEASLDVRLAFVDAAGRSTEVTIVAPPKTRRTVRVADWVGSADVGTVVEASGLVVAERAMYWGGGNPASGAGSSSPGLLQPSHTWNFAEGSTDHGFQTWLLLLNPNDFPTAVDVVYNTESGPIAREGLQMAPHSRATISVAADIGAADTGISVSASLPILAERAMYWDPGGESVPAGVSRAGHSSFGSATRSRFWRLAEGSTAHGLSEFVLIQNPGQGTASVRLDFLGEPGVEGSTTVVVPPGSRRTLRLNDLIPGRDISVAVTGSEHVVVERAMYTTEETGFLVMTGSLGSQ